MPADYDPSKSQGKKKRVWSRDTSPCLHYTLHKLTPPSNIYICLIKDYFFFFLNCGSNSHKRCISRYSDTWAHTYLSNSWQVISTHPSEDPSADPGVQTTTNVLTAFFFYLTKHPLPTHLQLHNASFSSPSPSRTGQTQRHLSKSHPGPCRRCSSWGRQPLSHSIILYSSIRFVPGILP